ncbi:hypothetical protein [Ideonella sp. BN130291]|uniref:hypothetical protein n=1 Tax=Ideonella sp. BN130291 TaxID=3112940 RepID=UPI002E2565AB|nr:hypothetical protein [Ideonella sp. BN130291]
MAADKNNDPEADDERHDAPAQSLAWRCSDCGFFRVKRDDEDTPPLCLACAGSDIEEVRPLTGHGRPAALTAAGRVVLGERRRFPRF